MKLFSWGRMAVVVGVMAVVFAALVAAWPGPGQSQQECYCNAAWPDQKTHNLTNSELSCCSCWELEILRNEIYARHGRIFNRKDLQKYFQAQEWYTPDRNNPDGTRGQNKFEKRNAPFILDFEKAQDCK